MEMDKPLYWPITLDTNELGNIFIDQFRVDSDDPLTGIFAYRVILTNDQIKQIWDYFNSINKPK